MHGVPVVQVDIVDYGSQTAEQELLCQVLSQSLQARYYASSWARVGDGPVCLAQSRREKAAEAGRRWLWTLTIMAGVVGEGLLCNDAVATLIRTSSLLEGAVAAAVGAAGEGRLASSRAAVGVTKPSQLHGSGTQAQLLI